MKSTILTILLIILQLSIISQYFQQEVNTTIELTLDDSLHQINAFEKIEYINNSKDTLDFIYFHLWPNAYKNNSTALAEQLDQSGNFTFRFSPQEKRGYIDSLDFKINNKSLKLEYDQNIDYVKVHLNTPLLPQKKVTITTPFRVKLPYGNISRLGHLDQAYQLTQWFPKPAVYDNNGWNVMPYLNQGEFYSEFGTYDVKITLPKNYVVGATGDLVNGEKEIEWLNKKAKETLKLIKNKEYKNKVDMTIPKSSKELKTLHYHQKNVHDFAIFMDKRWNVLKGEVELPNSKRKVTTWAMFTNNEFDLWKDAIKYIDSSIYYYSLWNGEYPYNQMTAVDGALTAGAGMEYPNVTVIGESHDAFNLEQVIVHEVGHNWFYGILGSNERKYAWLDEGINSFTEGRLLEHINPNRKFDLGNKKLSKFIGIDDYSYKDLSNLTYIFNARRNYDQPINITSPLFTDNNYGSIVYIKTAMGFNYLFHYLGESMFDKCMQTYFKRWKFKHPQPEDLRTVFEEVSKKDLSWFFDDFINTSKKIDYKTNNYNKKNNLLTVKNNSNIASPVSIYGIDDKNNILFSRWEDGFLGKKDFEVPSGAKKIILGYNKEIPDINKSNDIIKTSGLFKKSKPIKLKLLGEIENKNYYTINFTPVLGWNTGDKTMFGISLYNTTFPEKKFEWLLMPMYSYTNKTLTGVGNIKYNWYPTPIFRKLSLEYEGKTFSYNEPISEDNMAWYKNSLLLNAEVYNKKLRTAPTHLFSLAYHNIREKCYTDPTGISSDYINFSYMIKNKQILKPASFMFNYIYGDNTNNEIVNTISATGSIKLNYNLKRDGIYIRLFAGKSLYKSKNYRYNWRMSGQTGLYDYMFNNTYLGRTSAFPNLLAHQLDNSHGGFKTYTNTGSSNNWILAINSEIEIPKLPIGIFADFGLYPYKEITNNTTTDKIGNNFDAGIFLSLGNNILDIYLPLVFSKNISDEYEYKDAKFLQRVTFILRLNSLNPFKITRIIKP